jgi:integrase
MMSEYTPHQHDPAQPQSLWDSGAFHLKGEETLAAGEFRGWLSKVKGSDLASFIASVNEGTEPKRFTAKQVLELERLIYRCCDIPQGRWVALAILGKCIFHLNDLRKGPIPPARLVQLLKREQSTLRYGTVSAHRKIREWKNCAAKWIERLAHDPPTSKNVPASLVVIVSILSGYVLDADTAIALVKACADQHKRFGVTATGVYIDLPLAWRGLDAEESRRWYCDKRLGALIARVSSASADELLKGNFRSSIWGDFKSEFDKYLAEEQAHPLRVEDPERLEFAKREATPRSLAAMMKVMQEGLVTELPSILLEFLCRRIHGRSLSASSIGRITGYPSSGADQSAKKPVTPILTALLNEDNKIPTNRQLVVGSGGKEQDEEEPFWLIFLRDCFRGRTKRHEIVLELKKYARVKAQYQDDLRERESLDEPASSNSPQARNLETSPGDEVTELWASPIGDVLVEFAFELLKYEASSGRRWKAQTVAGCVLTVGRRFGCFLGNENLTEMSTVDLESRYLDTIENAALESKNPRSIQRSVSWALKEFNRFLNRKRPGKPSVCEAVVFKSFRGLIAVDARIISLEDCFKIISYIKEHVKDERERNIAIALLVLGFGAGLRRMEALGLRPIDWDLDNPSAPLMIREWEGRGLKTPNARRCLPLQALVQPGLLAEAAKALKNIRTDNDQKHLFGEVGDNESLRNKVIAAIHKAMGEVTGDRTMHYHLLRHSFATWTMLRLLAADHPELCEIFKDQLPRTYEWLMDATTFRASLYENNTVTNDHAWALACLLGHCSPSSISIEHYVHCLDLVAPYFLKRAFCGYGEEDLKSAIALKSSTASNMRSRHKEKTGEELTTEEMTTRFLSKRFKQHSRPTKEAPVQPHWIEATYYLLSIRATTGQEICDIAPYAGIDPNLANDIFERSRWLFQLNARGIGAGLSDSEQLLADPQLWCPKKPSDELKSEYLLFANNIATQIRRNEERALDALNGYVIGAISATETLFTDSQSANHFCSLLQKIDIPISALSLVLNGATAGVENEWKKRLGHRLKVGDRESPAGPQAIVDISQGTTQFSVEALTFAMGIAWLRFGSKVEFS